VARAFGAVGLTLEDPADCDRIVAQAFATPGPVVIEAMVDVNEPPMPAKIKPDQALHFAESLVKGTKDWQKIIKTVAEDKVRELV
jgi:Thiamine pyrophosphate-requiring enzymes [acetolactate synthase, pyruvate dehydrogenase (cytochrome), glyoxylate carboligase, phosphonopyruvate decarboxylase]